MRRARDRGQEAGSKGRRQGAGVRGRKAGGKIQWAGGRGQMWKGKGQRAESCRKGQPVLKEASALVRALNSRSRDVAFPTLPYSPLCCTDALMAGDFVKCDQAGAYS